jgi:hypothetical protein
MKEKKTELVFEDAFRRMLTEIVKIENEGRSLGITAKEQADLVLDILDFYQDAWTQLIETTVNHHLEIATDIDDDASDDDDDDDEEDED